MAEEYNLKRVYKKRGFKEQLRRHLQRTMGGMADLMTGGVGSIMLELGDSLARPKTTKKAAKRAASKASRRNK